MKTQSFLVCMLAMTAAAFSQNTVANGSGSGYVGLGTLTPGVPLDILTSDDGGAGIRIRQTDGDGEATIRLDAVNPGGREFGIHSIGSGWGSSGPIGSLMFRDETAVQPRLIIMGTGDVGIGNIAPGAKLAVTGTTLAIRGDAGTGQNDVGVLGTGQAGVEGNGTLVGVRGNCFNAGTFKIGVRGQSGLGSTNYGGLFVATSGTANTTSYGVYGQILNPAAGGVNYAVFGTVAGMHNSGIGPNWAGYFVGDVATAGGFYFYSDRNIKKNITGLNNSLELIGKLNPVNYYFDTETNNNLGLPSAKQYGFISQEVKEVLPELTKNMTHPATFDENGREIDPKREVLGLNYYGFIAILTKGIQEQQQQIASLEERLNDQHKVIESMNQRLSAVTGTSSQDDLIGGFEMSQNEPNPFTHETVVNYSLPASVSSAEMIVYDLSGKQIKSLPIDHKNASSITITSDQLAAGIYIYTIVADGQAIAIKKMIVAEK